MEVGSVVRVLRDFLTLNEGELSVVKDEVLQVIEVIDRHWVKCQGVRENSGLVPKSNIHCVENLPRSLETGHFLLVCDNSFVSETTGDLTITKGDILIGLEAIDDSWTRGRNLRGELGIFPSAFCWSLDLDLLFKSKFGLGQVEKFASVVHSMQALLDQEMDLVQGEIIKITEIVDKDWYRGEANGKSGIFPSSFVRIIDSFPGDAPPDSADLSSYLKKPESIDSFPGEAPPDSADLNSYPKEPQSLFDEDDYFRANLPPTYDMEPDPVDVFAFDEKNTSTTATKGGLDHPAEISAADYMNTRNAFHGLDEGLNTLAPKFEPAKLSFQTRTKSLLDEDDYFRANLPPTYDMEPLPVDAFSFDEKIISKTATRALTEEDTTVLGLANENCSKGYENMVKDLSRVASNSKKPEVRKNHLKKWEKEEQPETEVVQSKAECNNNLVTPYRYQTITFENLGYSGANVDVRPYGIVKHHFVAEFDNELGLNEGDMVYLIRYVDNEWLEAELDASRRGLVPISYINIIVDMMNVQHETAVTVHENLLPDTFHKVLYTFHGQMEGDLSVAEGEVVRVCEKQNEDWYVVENSSGEAGLFPGNHLDPSAEFSGKALFDIERLLSLKQVEEAKKISEKATNNINTNTNQSNNENWRFFDPLASPGGDDEMLKLEAILEEKAKKANQGLIIQEQRPDIIASTERKSRPRPAAAAKKKDIESLISNNLMKLRSLSPASKATEKTKGSSMSFHPNFKSILS